MLRITRLSARHEITRAMRARTFRLGLLLVSGLLVASFVLETQRLTVESRERDALTEHERTQWEQQPDRHPHRMAHYGLFVFRPPSPLGFFDAGVEPFTGNAVFLEPHRRNLPNFSAASQASELARFGRPTAAFVLQLLLPLLVFCATFDSVAGEREAGTLRLALAQGACTSGLLLGKLLGHVMLVTGWVVPGMTLAMVVHLASEALPTTTDNLLRVGVLALVYALYLAGCAALGVLVSALHRRAYGALITLLAVWLVCWVAVPRFASELAARTRPAPSRAQLELTIARATQGMDGGHGSDSPAAKALQDKLFAEHGVQRLEDLPVNVKGLLMQQAEDQTTALYDTHYGKLRAAQMAQNDFVQAFGVLSPPLALRTASMAVADSDLAAFETFLEQAEEYRTYFIAELNRLHTTKVRYEHDRATRVGREHFAAIRPFRHERRRLADTAPAMRQLAVAALAWLILLGWLAWRSLRGEEDRA